MLPTVLITTILLLLSTVQAGPVMKRGSGVSSLEFSASYTQP